MSGENPILEPMTAEERVLLERRAASEASGGTILLGAHWVFLAILLAIAMTSRPGQARAALFVGGIVLVSGMGWFVYLRLLAEWIARDLAQGRVAVARTRLVRKRLQQRKTTAAPCLYLDPPFPKKKTIVSRPAYDSVAEGDWLLIRYFPLSKVISKVERAG